VILPGDAPFSENFYGVMLGLSIGTCLSNLKSVALTVLELLLTGPLRTETHTVTHIERKQYLLLSVVSVVISAIHSVHLAEITSKYAY